jgi:hypothetical protein
VEVLGTLATAADAACGSSSSSGCDDGSSGGNGGSSAGVAPWLLTRSVQVEEFLAFLVACFQQGGAATLASGEDWTLPCTALCCTVLYWQVPLPTAVHRDPNTKHTY